MKRIYGLVLIILLVGLANSATLTVQDHSKVIGFLLSHPVALKNWLKSRGRSGRVRPEEVLNFILSLSRTSRGSAGIGQVVNRVRVLSRRTRGVRVQGPYNSVVQRIRSARSLEELRNILSSQKERIAKGRAANRMSSSLIIGLGIASQIIDDGMAKGIYSPESYVAFLNTNKRNRGILNALADEILDIAKNDAVGALVGAVAGPEGAVAGATLASSTSVAEMALDLILHPEPAY